LHSEEINRLCIINSALDDFQVIENEWTTCNAVKITPTINIINQRQCEYNDKGVLVSETQRQEINIKMNAMH